MLWGWYNIASGGWVSRLGVSGVRCWWVLSLDCLGGIVISVCFPVDIGVLGFRVLVFFLVGFGLIALCGMPF